MKKITFRGVQSSSKASCPARRGTSSKASIASLFSLLLLCGCTALMGTPNQKEIDRVTYALQYHIAPGEPESAILETFPIIRSYDWGKYGTMDIDEYRSKDYVSRTYWIGYYYNSGLDKLGYTRAFAITAINGKIESIYRP